MGFEGIESLWVIHDQIFVQIQGNSRFPALFVNSGPGQQAELAQRRWCVGIEPGPLWDRGFRAFLPFPQLGSGQSVEIFGAGLRGFEQQDQFQGVIGQFVPGIALEQGL